MNEAAILEAEARLRAAMFANDVGTLDQLLDDTLAAGTARRSPASCVS